MPSLQHYEPICGHHQSPVHWFASPRRLGVVALGLVVLNLLCRPGFADEIEIGASIASARQNLQSAASEIAVDSDDGIWHILVAKQSDRLVNLLFEQDRLRYISYDFHLGAYQPQQNSVAFCDKRFKAAVDQFSARYGKGSYNRTMAWPEREISMTWRAHNHFAVVRELSDLDGCLLVKAMSFDGNEADFKAFDQRMKHQ
jgi:stalled ribosome alternative rescue factor ArfA